MSRLNRNNFDLVRLLFASSVGLVHAYELSGYEQLSWIVIVLSSAVAVKGFFVISGFLIVMSYERSSSLKSYTLKRIRRIYPAYFVVVMLCAIILFLVSDRNIREYFSIAWIKYVLANLSFLNFLHLDLPGVFQQNKINAVNGALWSLKIEVMFYMVVPIFVYAIRRFGRLPTLIVSYCLSFGYVVVLSRLAMHSGSTKYNELAHQLPGQLTYFMSGAFLYYFLPTFERYIWFFLLSAVAFLIANVFYSMAFFEPFALAVVVVFFGLYWYVGNFGKYGDFSYGVYIIHFPIIQVLVYERWFSESPVWFLIVVVVVTIVGAMLMWHLIEKKFLSSGSHYINAVTRNNDHTSDIKLQNR